MHAGVAMVALLLRAGADPTPFDRLAISAGVWQRADKEQLFRVFLATFDESTPTRAQFSALPALVRDRVRTLLLCWAQLRNANGRVGVDAANLGHCDALVLKSVVHHLWRLERAAFVAERAAVAPKEHQLLRRIRGLRV